MGNYLYTCMIIVSTMAPFNIIMVYRYIHTSRRSHDTSPNDNGCLLIRCPFCCFQIN